MSTSICWGLKFLADDQQAQQTLRQALRDEFTSPLTTNDSPTAKKISSSRIPYLDATIEEILRCANTINSIVRIATVDTQVLGHQIPKGTDVFVMINGPCFKSPPLEVNESSRNSSIKDGTGAWDVADISLFKPERWLVRHDSGKLEFNSKAGPNLQFGLGPRGCFGEQMTPSD